MGIIVCFLDEKMIFKFCTVNPIFVKKPVLNTSVKKLITALKSFEKKKMVQWEKDRTNVN